jgi:hypothetical protein
VCALGACGSLGSWPLPVLVLRPCGLGTFMGPRLRRSSLRSCFLPRSIRFPSCIVLPDSSGWSATFPARHPRGPKPAFAPHHSSLLERKCTGLPQQPLLHLPFLRLVGVGSYTPRFPPCSRSRERVRVRDLRGLPLWSRVLPAFGVRAIARPNPSRVRGSRRCRRKWPVPGSFDFRASIYRRVCSVRRHCWHSNALSFHGFLSPPRSFLRRRVSVHQPLAGPSGPCALIPLFLIPPVVGPECGIPFALPRWPSRESVRSGSCVLSHRWLQPGFRPASASRCP